MREKREKKGDEKGKETVEKRKRQRNIRTVGEEEVVEKGQRIGIKG